jgi:hypothetical protein
VQFEGSSSSSSIGASPLVGFQEPSEPSEPSRLVGPGRRAGPVGPVGPVSPRGTPVNCQASVEAVEESDPSELAELLRDCDRPWLVA